MHLLKPKSRTSAPSSVPRLRPPVLQFYAMVNFCNPGLLGTPSQFRRYYEAPILAGREPDATELQQALGQERSQELSAAVNEFILRRTNTILSDHLPPKVSQWGWQEKHVPPPMVFGTAGWTDHGPSKSRRPGTAAARKARTAAGQADA